VDVLIEMMGWTGSVCIVAAYALNSYQKLKSDSLPFLLLNIGGGILLIVYSVSKDAYANVFINIVWVAIAIPAIIKVIRYTKRT
jgi:hypothetical protein